MWRYRQRLGPCSQKIRDSGMAHWEPRDACKGLSLMVPQGPANNLVLDLQRPDPCESHFLLLKPPGPCALCYSSPGKLMG